MGKCATERNIIISSSRGEKAKAKAKAKASPG
jgi:hypothetical protein